MLQNDYAKAIVTIIAPLAIAGVVAGRVAAAAPPRVGGTIAILLGALGGLAAVRLVTLLRPELIEQYSTALPDEAEVEN